MTSGTVASKSSIPHDSWVPVSQKRHSCSRSFCSCPMQEEQGEGDRKGTGIKKERVSNKKRDCNIDSVTELLLVAVHIVHIILYCTSITTTSIWIIQVCLYLQVTKLRNQLKLSNSQLMELDRLNCELRDRIMAAEAEGQRLAKELEEQSRRHEQDLITFNLQVSVITRPRQVPVSLIK